MTTVATRIVMLGLSFLYIFTLLLAGCSTLGRANVVINGSADAELKTTVKRGLFLTTAHIGDREAGPFLIDTGASDLFFDVELAKALKLSFWGEEEHAETKQKIKAQFGFQGVHSTPPREGRSPGIGLLCRLRQWAILTR